MRRLNRAAAEALRRSAPRVHAVTDVTGYGLAGHGVGDGRAHRACGSSSTPPGSRATRRARRIADAGHRTGGDPRNRDYLAGHLDRTAAAGGEALCFDPQTSGGLLAAVDPSWRDDLLAADGWWRVGEVDAGEPVLVLR